MFFEEFAGKVAVLLGAEDRHAARMFEEINLTFEESLAMLESTPLPERAWFAECPTPEQVRGWASRWSRSRSH